MKKTIALILALMMALTLLTGCGSQPAPEEKNDAPSTSQPENNAPDDEPASEAKAEEPVGEQITMRVGIGSAADSELGKGVTYFGEILNEKSGGLIQVELCAGGMLGGDRETIEGVGLGTIEMCNITTGPISNFSEAFLALDLPYVVTDRETAYAVLDGEQGRAVLDTLEDVGIYGMSFWELGFRDLYNNKKIIEHPGDLEGLKVRVMENDIYLSLINGLGAFATPMSISEVFTALQQKTIDGFDNPIGVALAGKYYEACGNCTKTHHVYSSTVSMINRAFFDGLPEQYQKWILEADTEARDYERQLVIDSETAAYESWIENGGTTTDIDVNEWAEACGFVVDKYADQIDMDFVNALRGS